MNHSFVSHTGSRTLDYPNPTGVGYKATEDIVVLISPGMWFKLTIS